MSARANPEIEEARDRAMAHLTDAASALDQLHWLFDQLAEHGELPSEVCTMAAIGLTLSEVASARVMAEIDALLALARRS